MPYGTTGHSVLNSITLNEYYIHQIERWAKSLSTETNYN